MSDPINLPFEEQNQVTVTATPSPTPDTTSSIIDTPIASNPGQIRNIIQTAQEREIIKTAPDLVVLIDGLSFLENGYILPQDGSNTNYTLVHFNSHVIGFSAGYDTDQLVPTCTINLSVPNHEKYLYQAPGGNNILKTMDELIVYAKGYWLSTKGNSLYHRVFKGVIKNVSHHDNGKTLDISIQGAGILYFFQFVQLELHAPIQNNSDSGTQVMVSKYSNMTPYEMIAATFRDQDLRQGFQVPTANYNFNAGQALTNNPNVSPWAQAIQAGYISKWQAILTNLEQDVHVFGVQPPDPSQPTLIRIPASTDPSQANLNHQLQSTVKESDQINSNIYLNLIREHLPEWSVGNVEMFNGRMTSRLERLRYLIEMIGFEGYQDVNGSIIIKPPLYNLDCTLIDDTTNPNNVVPTTGTQAASTAIQNLSTSNNPFIIYLSEILDESEVEDEAGIMATRLQVQGSLSPGQAFADVENNIKHSGEFIDIDKLSRFGLREPPIKMVPWIPYQDTKTMFAVACWELQKANKGWRTYTVIIPLRPELKLGFPVFFPHKDMYGYVKSISHSYQYGDSATTTVTLDTLRKRPMFPTSVNSTSTSSAPISPSTTQPIKYYSQQSSLVHKMTTLSSTTSSSSIAQQLSSAPTASTSGQGNADPTVVLTNNPTSINTPPNQTITNPSPDQVNLEAYRNQQLQAWTGLPYDTPGQCYRIQVDHSFDNPIPADGSYLTLLTGTIGTSSTQGQPSIIPYTNQNGYEVIAPFPWGRYTSLRRALYECCQGFNISPNPVSNGIGTLTGAQTFLFSGVGNPVDASAGDVLQSTLASLSALVNDTSIFELTYSDAATAAMQTVTPQTAQLSASQQSIVSDLESTISAKAQMMVTGLPNTSPTISALNQLQLSTPSSVITPTQISNNLAALTAAANVPSPITTTVPTSVLGSDGIYYPATSVGTGGLITTITTAGNN
jgi:hypothetical protein